MDVTYIVFEEQIEQQIYIFFSDFKSYKTCINI